MKLLILLFSFIIYPNAHASRCGPDLILDALTKLSSNDIARFITSRSESFIAAHGQRAFDRITNGLRDGSIEYYGGGAFKFTQTGSLALRIDENFMRELGEVLGNASTRSRSQTGAQASARANQNQARPDPEAANTRAEQTPPPGGGNSTEGSSANSRDSARVISIERNQPSEMFAKIRRNFDNLSETNPNIIRNELGEFEVKDTAVLARALRREFNRTTRENRFIVSLNLMRQLEYESLIAIYIKIIILKNLGP